MAKSYKSAAVDYAQDVVDGKIVCGKEVRDAARRFLSDLARDDLTLHTKEPDFVIGIIERLMVHKQGETLEGRPLTNKPLLLQPWQVFIVYNLVGFYYKGRPERRYKEAFIFVPRKNGKTMFIAALAFGLAMLERKSGARIYIVAASQKQACQSFEDIVYTLRYQGLIEEFRVRDNNVEHSIYYEFLDDNGRPCGSIAIEALASNPDAQDSFNCNIAIADEMHAFKKASQYNRFKEAMKAYTNKLMIGITTAGDNINSFCYRRLEYAIKVVSGELEDDSLFAFISKADQDDKGNVNFTDPVQHQKANPSYGVTIRPSDIMQDAIQAQNDPQQRKDFLSRSLNIYTSALRAYFDLSEFRWSDEKYNWTQQELTRLVRAWYGGADLSKLHDLTAAVIAGEIPAARAVVGDWRPPEDVLVLIPHCWFPVIAASEKADEDQIPLFGWRDDGWLDMPNTPSMDPTEPVKQFLAWRAAGFSIRRVGHDRKFARPYYTAMRKAGFRVQDQPQLYLQKSEGFRYIEHKAKVGCLYYLHAEPFEYCVANVHAVEKVDDAVQYDKSSDTSRIDVFDAAVFATIRLLIETDRSNSSGWFEEPGSGRASVYD